MLFSSNLLRIIFIIVHSHYIVCLHLNNGRSAWNAHEEAATIFEKVQKHLRKQVVYTQKMLKNETDALMAYDEELQTSINALQLDEYPSKFSKYLAFIQIKYVKTRICAYMGVLIAQNALIAYELVTQNAINIYFRAEYCTNCKVHMHVVVGVRKCSYELTGGDYLNIQKVWLAEKQMATVVTFTKNITVNSDIGILKLPHRLSKLNELCVIVTTGRYFSRDAFAINVRILKYFTCSDTELSNRASHNIICVEIENFTESINYCSLLTDGSPLICNDNVIVGLYSGISQCSGGKVAFFSVAHESATINAVLRAFNLASHQLNSIWLQFLLLIHLYPI